MTEEELKKINEALSKIIEVVLDESDKQCQELEKIISKQKDVD